MLGLGTGSSSSSGLSDFLGPPLRRQAWMKDMNPKCVLLSPARHSPKVLPRTL